MKCHKCGFKNYDGVNFCQGCGSNLNEWFCGNCGYKNFKHPRCVNCGAERLIDPHQNSELIVGNCITKGVLWLLTAIFLLLAPVRINKIDDKIDILEAELEILHEEEHSLPFFSWDEELNEEIEDLQLKIDAMKKRKDVWFAIFFGSFVPGLVALFIPHRRKFNNPPQS